MWKIEAFCGWIGVLRAYAGATFDLRCLVIQSVEKYIASYIAYFAVLYLL